jgi:hypothetical protein
VVGIQGKVDCNVGGTGYVRGGGCCRSCNYGRGFVDGANDWALGKRESIIGLGLKRDGFHGVDVARNG